MKKETGNLLYDFRKALDISQTKMAKILKTSQPNYSKMEAGDLMPRADVFIRAYRLAVRSRTLSATFRGFLEGVGS